MTPALTATLARLRELEKKANSCSYLIKPKAHQEFSSAACNALPELLDALEARERAFEVMKDALLRADRFFKAKDGVYSCDVGLSEKSAKYGVDKALTQIREIMGEEGK